MQINRVKLVYYSPTGTSEKTVKAIQKGIDIPYDVIDLTPPDSETKQHKLKPTDLTIIAAPVYNGRIAPTAANRINNLKGKDTPAGRDRPAL